VFQGGDSYLTGHADQEADERQDFVEALGIRSEILCRFQVDGESRGVLQALSTRPDRLAAADLPFFEVVGGWMGSVAWRAELVEQVARDAVQSIRRLAAEQLARLTRREREVAQLVASGLTNEQIAERLVLVPGTVSNHIAHILRKLGFTRRVQIATWAFQHGLLLEDAG
jgi:DNA-binding NarL/FixJ family response regulator